MKNDKLTVILLLIDVILICTTVLFYILVLHWNLVYTWIMLERSRTQQSYTIFFISLNFFVYRSCVSFTPYSVRHFLKNCFFIQKLKIAPIPFTRQPLLKFLLCIKYLKNIITDYDSHILNCFHFFYK